MYFTQEDFKKIEQYIKKTAVKDTEFPTASTTIGDEDSIVIVQDGINKIMTIKELIINVSDYVTTEGATYLGVATPTTTPWTDGRHKVWYFAYEGGTYGNFGDITLSGDRLVILRLSNPEANTWVMDDIQVNIKAIDIANESLTVADRALSIAGTFKSDLVEVKTASEVATGMAEKAFTASNEAIDKANKAVKISDRGIPGGVPILDADGKIPQSQLPLTKTELVDSYKSDRTDAAPTAAALNRLYKYHEQDIVSNKNLLDAILDMVSSSIELGVSPTNISISSLAQDVKIQIVCNGDWNISEIPANVTATPAKGTGNSVCTLSFPANTSQDTEVTGTIKVTNSYNKEKIINYRQFTATMVYKYSLTATPETLNILPSAGTGAITVVSTKIPAINGESIGEAVEVPFTTTVPTSDSWFTITNKDYTYKENTLEANRSTKITITQTEEGGETVEIPVTQSKATMNTVYKFSITPANASITDSGLGGTYPITITSTKTVTLNESVTTSDVPYLVSFTGQVTADWATYSKENNNIVLLVNPDTTDRVGSIKFTQESPMTNIIEVPITQKGAVEEWRYTFEYSPLTMEFSNIGSTKTYSVTKSVKQKYINGIIQGEEIDVPWTVELTGEGFTLNTENSSVTSSDNTGAQRAGTLTFKRAEVPNEDKTITITQSAGVITYTYELVAIIDNNSYSELGDTVNLSMKSIKKKYLNDVFQEDINVPYRVTSSASFLTHVEDPNNPDPDMKIWRLSENTTESARTATLTVTQLEDDGLTKNIEVSQKAGVITWEYSFSTSPTSLSFITTGGQTHEVTVNSTKQKKVNGKNSGSPVSVDYTSAITAGTIYGINRASITSSANNTESVATGTATFTQNESNKTSTVALSTAAGAVTYTYTFQCVMPTAQATAVDGFAQVQVSASYKTKHINNVNTGQTTNVGWTLSATNSGGEIASINGSTATFPENTSESNRMWNMVCTQAESGIQKTSTVMQAGAKVEYRPAVNMTPRSIVFEASHSGTYVKQTISVTAWKQLYINDVYKSQSPLDTVAVLIPMTANTFAGNGISISGVTHNTGYSYSFEVWPLHANSTGDDYLCDMQIESIDRNLIYDVGDITQKG